MVDCALTRSVKPCNFRSSHRLASTLFPDLAFNLLLSSPKGAFHPSPGQVSASEGRPGLHAKKRLALKGRSIDRSDANKTRRPSYRPPLQGFSDVWIPSQGDVRWRSLALGWDESAPSALYERLVVVQRNVRSHIPPIPPMPQKTLLLLTNFSREPKNNTPLLIYLRIEIEIEIENR